MPEKMVTGDNGSARKTLNASEPLMQLPKREMAILDQPRLATTQTVPRHKQNVWKTFEGRSGKTVGIINYKVREKYRL